MKDTLKQGDRGADVRQLQTDLNALGANLAVDGIFGDKTYEQVYDFQSSHGLEPDGVVGPKTWTELGHALLRRVVPGPRKFTDEDLAHWGRFAVEMALHWWQRDIYDPKTDDDSELAKESKQAIDYFIRQGLGWTWLPPYEGDGSFEWCLAFVMKCWEHIKPDLRKLYGASTYRVDRFASYQTAFGEKNETPRGAGPHRLYAKCDETTKVEDLKWIPRAGDIVLIGTKGYGTHGALVRSFDPATGEFVTVEGNATGWGPNGERQQGVVLQKRKLGSYVGEGVPHVRRIARPGIEDVE